MSDVIISVENLGKKYILSHQGNGAGGYNRFSERLEHWAKTPMRWLQQSMESRRVGAFHGKSKSGGGDLAIHEKLKGGVGGVEHSGIHEKLDSAAREEFWALKGVSFEVKRGEVVGIIGRNGAGKSTLLKILSRITEPTEGRVTLRGRVASLLEVGTGFHPELTGRENIFLNGAILGMTKAEIRKKFDEIVAFAEVERFLDTPVKRYSSGMYVRLAFAVAAHLEPEILVVDEVLAVGDAEFQKKCLGKMKDVATGGRTVLFVSHNMGAVSSLCENVLCLSAGKVLGHGGTQEQISTYLRQKEKSSLKANGPLAEYVGIQKIVIHKKTMFAKKPPTIEATVEYEIRRKVDSFRPFLGISQMGIRICTWEGNPTRNDAERGLQQITFKIPISYLKNGIYSVSVGAISKDKINWVWVEDAENIEVFEHDINDPNQIRDGLVYLPQGD